MKVVDLHPEDLLEKDARGALTDAERARLEAHLARCATCRFEREVRADFADELADEVELSGAELVALVEGSPLASASARARATGSQATLGSEPPDGPRGDEGDELEPRRRPSSRPRRNVRVALLVAAALLVGGIAGAGVGIRTLSHLVRMPVEATVSPRIEKVAVPAPSAKDLVPVPSATAAPPPELAPPSEPSPSEVAPPSPRPVPEADAPVRTSPPAPSFALSAWTSSPSSPSSRALAGDPPRPVASVPRIDPAALTTASAVFDAANDARRRGDYGTAVDLLKVLQSRHAASPEAHVSYATMGRLLLDRGDAAGALAAFDAYGARGHGVLDEAVMVGRASALERLGRTGEARAAWGNLLAAFPGSPYLEHARARVEDASPP